MKAQIIIYNAVNYLLFSNYLQMVSYVCHYLLYFIRLNNLHFAKNLNIALDHVITVPFVFVCICFTS